MADFDFLKNLSLAEPKKESAERKAAPEMKGDLRVFRSGKFVFKQEDLKNLFYDFFTSKELFGYPEENPEVLFMIAHKERVPRIDFAGKANGSAYLKRRFADLCKFFGVSEDSSFLDFQINAEEKVPFEKVFLGKEVLKGEKKGSLTYVVRENIKLIPVSLITEEGEIISVIKEEVKEEKKEEVNHVWVNDTSGDIRDGM